MCRLYEIYNSHLKWESTGKEKPSEGRELTNPKLSEALASKPDFRREEWDTFGIQDLHTGDFIKSYDSYFKLVHEKFKDIKSGMPMRIFGFQRGKKIQNTAKKAIAKIKEEDYKESNGLEAVCDETAKQKFWEDEKKCLRVSRTDGPELARGTPSLAGCARKVRKYFAKNAPIGPKHCETHNACLLNHCKRKKQRDEAQRQQKKQDKEEADARRKKEVDARRKKKKAKRSAKRSQRQDAKDEKEICRKESLRQSALNMCREVENASNLENYQQKVDLRDRVETWFSASSKPYKIVMLREGLVPSLMSSGWLDISSQHRPASPTAT